MGKTDNNSVNCGYILSFYAKSKLENAMVKLKKLPLDEARDILTKFDKKDVLALESHT